MKTCRDCGIVKPLSEFYKHFAMKDGHLNKCVECVKDRICGYRRKNLDKIRRYDRERGKTEKRLRLNRERGRRFRARYAHLQKRWAEENKNKRAAHSILGHAIRSGRVVKPKRCEHCKKSRQRLEGHHEDYSRPLLVLWVCRKCHAKIHRKYDDE